LCYNGSMIAENLLMSERERSKGRARMSRFAKMFSVRLTAKQVEWVDALAERYQCDAADVIRRGLTELARREKLNGDGEEKGPA